MESTSNRAAAEPKSIIVVGAGLAGCMMALLLAQRRADVPIKVLENRADWRSATESTEMIGGVAQVLDAGSRSINLALSERGIVALKKVGLWQAVQSLLLPMRGRMVHIDASNGSSTRCNEQLYGTRAGQHINSVSRPGLNDLLLQELAALPNVEILFQHKVIRLEHNGAAVRVRVGGKGGEQVVMPALYVIGADGAFSTVRPMLKFCGARPHMQERFVRHGYKELCMLPNEDGTHKMSPNYLHIWPRHDFMLIALPNPDGSFTCTYFGRWDGENGLDKERSIDEIRRFFRQHFADVPTLIPDFAEQFVSRKASPMMEVRMDPWNAGGRVCLIGDAAHSLVPFYGQGMNCAFQDALVLDGLLARYGDDSARAFAEFSRVWRPAADALADLSLANYREMASLTARPWFSWKKALERFLTEHVPASGWEPIYSMVSFSTLPYDKALAKAQQQDRVLKLVGVSLLSVLTAGVAAGVFCWRVKDAATDDDTAVDAGISTGANGSDVQGRTIGNMLDSAVSRVSSWIPASVRFGSNTN
ncbi:MAG: hypothetical protein MHM6MM_002761 [Cercozoa sp. M6MM]